MKITPTDKLPDLNVVGLNKILQIKPDNHIGTLKRQDDARKDEHIEYLHHEQNAELKDFPKCENIMVDDKSTFMNPAIKSKRNLIDWVLAMLGYPLVTVELAEVHFNTAIQNALEIYTKYATFPRKYLIKSSFDYEPGVGIDLSRENVAQVYDLQYGHDFSAWGCIFSWMTNRTSNGMYGSGNLTGSFITAHNFIEFKKMAQKVLATQPDWSYNQVVKRLVLIPEPKHRGCHCDDNLFHSEVYHDGYVGLDSYSHRHGIPIVIECEIEPPLQELYCNEHIKKLTLAYCKIMLGQIRGKFEGIGLPGGGSVSKEIGQEGKEELQQIMENLRAEVSMGQEFYFV